MTTSSTQPLIHLIHLDLQGMATSTRKERSSTRGEELGERLEPRTLLVMRTVISYPCPWCHTPQQRLSLVHLATQIAARSSFFFSPSRSSRLHSLERPRDPSLPRQTCSQTCCGHHPAGRSGLLPTWARRKRCAAFLLMPIISWIN